MKNDWQDARPAAAEEGRPGRWFVRVRPSDRKRETAIEMWRFLEARGATRDQVERIDDHSFKVWVEDKAIGQAWYDALVATFGK